MFSVQNTLTSVVSFDPQILWLLKVDITNIFCFHMRRDMNSFDEMRIWLQLGWEGHRCLPKVIMLERLLISTASEA